MHNNRYALLTVDTEALPRRASENHVQRLMWGKHEQGTAGVVELANIGNSFGVKHTFFVDLCAAFESLNDVKEVIAWLDADGQDVQLHTHPEYLSVNFKKKHGLLPGQRHMNRYKLKQNIFVLGYFSELLASITKKTVLAHRAGSFRWNADTLRALKRYNIPLSFNNSMRAMLNEQCPFSIPQNTPFLWSNGIYEVPMTEQERFLQSNRYDRLQFPKSFFLNVIPSWLSFLPYTLKRSHDFVVALMHSWSLLHWDENGHAMYKDEKHMEQYYAFLKRLSRDYDIITTPELLDLLQNGKIAFSHTEDVNKAAYIPRKK